MADEISTREVEPRFAEANPFRAPAEEAAPAASLTAGKILLLVVEWTLGLPMVLLGLAQCGLGTLFFGLSFATEGEYPRALLALLFMHGSLLALPGALLSIGRTGRRGFRSRWVCSTSRSPWRWRSSAS